MYQVIQVKIYSSAVLQLTMVDKTSKYTYIKQIHKPIL